MRVYPSTLLLLSVVAFFGCQSGVTRIPVSPQSEMGKMMREMDAVEEQSAKNWRLYDNALKKYEAAQGRTCKSFECARRCEPIEVVGSRTQIGTLEGGSHKCGWHDYRVRVMYEDDAYRIVKEVEVLERMDLQTSASLARPIKTALVPIATLRCEFGTILRLQPKFSEAHMTFSVRSSTFEKGVVGTHIMRVRGDKKSEAVEILRKDAETQNYEAVFY
jgi:hypothetical protein